MRNNGKGLLSFDNGFAINFVIFGVDNTSWPHTDNQKMTFLVVLGQGLTEGINNSLGAAKKKGVSLSKANTKFSLSLHYNGDESYLYVNKTKICKF